MTDDRISIERSSGVPRWLKRLIASTVMLAMISSMVGFVVFVGLIAIGNSLESTFSPAKTPKQPTQRMQPYQE
jgi:hypothetical protein